MLKLSGRIFAKVQAVVPFKVFLLFGAYRQLLRLCSAVLELCVVSAARHLRR